MILLTFWLSGISEELPKKIASMFAKSFVDAHSQEEINWDNNNKEVKQVYPSLGDEDKVKYGKVVLDFYMSMRRSGIILFERLVDLPVIEAKKTRK